MSNQLATIGPKASDQLANFLGIEKSMMLETLKVQCFKGKRPDEVSDAQLAAFVSTANVLEVNPLIPGMLYAYPERNGGITPILGPDGVFKKLDEFIASGKLRGYECEVKMGADGKPESATAIIHRAGEQVSAKYTAYFSEWSVTSNPNWQARPRHMIWVRAIKQAARQVIHGLPMDADEYEIAQMTNVTPEAEAPVTRPEPPARKPRGATAVQEATVVTEVATPAQTPAEAPKPAEEVKPTPAADIPAGVHGDAAEAEQIEAQQKPRPLARASLADGESMEATITVKEVNAGAQTKGGVPTGQYYTKAIVGGDYAGEVIHLDAGHVEPDPKNPAKSIPVPNAPWAQGAKLKLKLIGKKMGVKVLVSVQAVESAGDEMEMEG